MIFLEYPKCSTCRKAKAWLDLNDKKNAGVHVDSRDIKKHRNDVLRIALDLKTLGLPNVKLMDLIELLKAIYC